MYSTYVFTHSENHLVLLVICSHRTDKSTLHLSRLESEKFTGMLSHQQTATAVVDVVGE